ncbi:MAG: OmpA family protein [Zoogloeaceae bacterium]|jgi:outer membrane protein OmpA-like peptidoglycan-associated protein|nr:OmpA family protein [Zoogloeaceae bacterium]
MKSRSFRFFLSFFAICLLAACQTPTGLTAEQIIVLKDNGFTETESGWELNLESRLLFDISSAELNQQERVSLDKIARTLLSVQITNIVIEGHTDSTGTMAYNRELSRKRASIVANYLASVGMPADRMQIKGMGSDVPIASNKTLAGRKENRRTVIIIPVPGQ